MISKNLLIDVLLENSNVQYCYCRDDNGWFEDGTVRCGTISVESIDIEANLGSGKCILTWKFSDFLIDHQ